MARVRYIGHEPVTVPELGTERVVHPDEIVTVPDERYWGYACQAANWEEVEPPAGFAAPGTEPSPAAAAEPVAETLAAKKTMPMKTAAKASQKGD